MSPIAQPLHLQHVWVDRARVLRAMPGPRIEGETRMFTQAGPWFPCRLPPRQDAESHVRPERRTRTNDSRQMTCSLVGYDGSATVVKEKDRIEVELGPTREPAGVWEVLQSFVPRNGQGYDLLLVLTVAQVDEHRA